MLIASSGFIQNIGTGTVAGQVLTPTGANSAPTWGQMSVNVYKQFSIYPSHHTTTIEELTDFIRVYKLGGQNANLKVYYSFTMPYDYKLGTTIYIEVILYGSDYNMQGQYVMLGMCNDGGYPQPLGCDFTRARRYGFMTKSYGWLYRGIGDTEEILHCYFARCTNALILNIHLLFIYMA